MFDNILPIPEWIFYTLEALATVAIIALVGMFWAMPHAAKVLLFNRLRRKTLILIAREDHRMALQPADVYPEGIAEVRYGRAKKWFLLPSSQYFEQFLKDVEGNSEEEKEANREQIMSEISAIEGATLKPYGFEGAPCYMVYEGLSIAVNPVTLAGLSFKTSQLNHYKGKLAIQNVKLQANGGTPKPIEFKVLLPVNPLSIQKFFPFNYAQNQIEAFGLKREKEGMQSRENRDRIIILGAIIIGVMAIAVTAILLYFHP
jgi:hypothetical protein